MSERETEHGAQQSRGFVERRQDVHSQAIIKLIDSLEHAVAELRQQMQAHEEATRNAVKQAMAEAFPDGDPDGHRRHHELVIQREKERLEFWTSMKKEVVKWGLLGVLAFVAVASWKAFLNGPVK